MSDGAAPAAPSAPASSNGTTPGTAQAPSAAKPAAGGAPKPRLADGRYGPKDGSPGAVPPESRPDASATPAPKPGETKEEFRLRMKLKSRSGEEEVNLSEADIRREIQQGRGYQRKVQELQRQLAEREEKEKLSESNLDEYLRAKGVDPDEYARKRIGELINLEAMSEEQRTALQVQRERDELAAKLKQREDAEKSVKTELVKQQLKAQRIAKYTSALAATGVPLGSEAEKAEMVWRMATTEARLADEDGTHDFTPEELAQETVRSAKADGKFYLQSLSTASLISELGAARVEAILTHTISEFEKDAGQQVTRPVATQTPATSDGSSSPYIDPRELEERMKTLRNGRR